MTKTHVIAIHDHPRRMERMEFDVDFSTGEMSNLIVVGINPNYAASQLRSIAHARWASFAWQQSYPTPTPMRTPEHLAWHLMAWGWKLEGELSQFQLPPPDPTPEGAVN